MTLIPTRLLILQRLTALLEQTSFEYRGVPTSLEGAVFRGRNIMGEESKPWPALTIMEAPVPDFALYAGEENQNSSSRWTLLIQGVSEDDKLNPLDAAYYLYAAVELQMMKIMAVKSSGSAMYPEHYLLGKLIASVELSPPVIRQPDDKASAAAFFFLPVRVGIATRSGEPYTQVP